MLETAGQVADLVPERGVIGWLEVAAADHAPWPARSSLIGRARLRVISQAPAGASGRGEQQDRKQQRALGVHDLGDPTKARDTLNSRARR